MILETVSLESLFWILRSIEEDKMEPNLILASSRFKECFALKIDAKDWSNFACDVL